MTSEEAPGLADFPESVVPPWYLQYDSSSAHGKRLQEIQVGFFNSNWLSLEELTVGKPKYIISEK